MSTIALHVNVDHVATLRQARGTRYPDPVEAALMAERAGADGITVHLREDRRHIQDRDVHVMREVVRGTYNLEMAATEAMLAIALAVKPDHVTLVPERREERTTEGGLDVVGQRAHVIERVTGKLQSAGIKVSLFIAADDAQIDASRRSASTRWSCTPATTPTPRGWRGPRSCRSSPRGGAGLRARHPRGGGPRAHGENVGPRGGAPRGGRAQHRARDRGGRGVRRAGRAVRVDAPRDGEGRGERRVSAPSSRGPSRARSTAPSSPRASRRAAHGERRPRRRPSASRRARGSARASRCWWAPATTAATASWWRATSRSGGPAPR
jgi:hypothetical protein